MNAKAKITEKKDMKKIILIIGLVCLVVGLVFIGRSKHKTIHLSNLSNQEMTRTPAAKPVTEQSGAEGDGIISFEMYPNPNKAVAKAAPPRSREAVIRFVMEAVSGIEDDLTAKNAVISQVSGLNVKLTGKELLDILEQAGITDEFYFTNTVKSVVAYLQYPLTEEEFNSIIARVKDTGYQFKLRTILDREQARHALP